MWHTLVKQSGPLLAKLLPPVAVFLLGMLVERELVAPSSVNRFCELWLNSPQPPIVLLPPPSPVSPE